MSLKRVLGFPAFLRLPNRELELRLQLLEAFNERSDPRQGLLHNVDVLLELLHEHFRLESAVISLQGPEPRVFQRGSDASTRLLEESAAAHWRERLSVLPGIVGCLCTGANPASVVGVHLDPFPSGRVRIDEATRRVLLELGPQTLYLPLMSYGKPLGRLCLSSREPAFTASDVRWLSEAMRELLPLLERSDLLEQLQRETAAHERERIGRDLHDSAVQPYLGLKYGLEALAREASADNPVAPSIRQLVEMTNQELQELRDVVTGLRSGQDPMGPTAFMAALERQSKRFEALYGLKVHIVAPHDLQLRGSVAKSVLHMVNEALTNARRHTAATAVTVTLDVRGSEVVLSLRNDHGPAAAIKGSLPEPFLPRSLSERASELGGGVTVKTEPNFSEILVTIPMLAAHG